MPLATLLTLAALAQPPTLTDTHWTLVQLKPNRTWITLSQQVPKPTLFIRGSAVTGFTACSPLSGKANYTASRLSLSQLEGGSTAQCPDRIIDLREDYLGLLRAATRYQVRGDTLTIWAATGVLIFRALPQP